LNSVAVLDASVLYPAPLRDLLLHQSNAGLFAARWSDLIHDEWTRNLLEDRPDLTSAQLTRTRALMNLNVEASLVTGFEGLIPSLTLPDPDDRHVLAAAIHAEANQIVTMNLKHFPAAALELYGIEPVHPDAFMLRLFQTAPILVFAGLKKQRASLSRPPVTQVELLETLERQGLKRFVARVREDHGAF
jgi:predicted nucleic acid-binding protein